MLKRLQVLSLLFFLAFPSTTILAAESPEFIKIKDWKLEKIGTNKMVLTCKAVFYNPNKAKVKLTDINLEVAIGDTKVGKILQFEKKVKIKKQQAFEIPLKIEIKPETNAWGYIQGFLAAVSMQDFVVHVIGHLKVSVLGIPLKIRVDESDDMNFKEMITN